MDKEGYGEKEVFRERVLSDKEGYGEKEVFRDVFRPNSTECFRTSPRSLDHRILCLVVFLSSKESFMEPRTYMLRLTCILVQTHVSLEHYPLIYLLV